VPRRKALELLLLQMDGEWDDLSGIGSSEMAYHEELHHLT